VARSIKRFRRYGRGCDVAFCVSNAIAGYVMKQLAIKNALVVPNGSDPDRFGPAATSLHRVDARNGRVLNVVWMGSAKIPWHDLDTIIKSARLLDKERETPIAFHLIGDGTESVQELPPNVGVHGPIQYEDLPAWLARMDVGLCLYKPGPGWFSSPLKAFDYMASGLMVVASEQAQLHEIFRELGHEDMMIPYGDHVALTRLLEKLAQHKEVVREYGRRGRDLVVNKYNWARTVATTMGELENLVKGRRR
jgi:starch synthase